MPAVEGDLGVQLQPPARQRSEHMPHRRLRRRDGLIRVQRRAGLDELVIRERLQLGAQLVGGGHQGRLERDHGGGAGLDGGVPGDLEQPQRLDAAVGGLRGGQLGAGENLAGGVLGVEQVALAGQSPLALAWWPVDLANLVSLPAQEAGQADAVGAGALHAEGDQPPGRPHAVDSDAEQLSEPIGGGRHDQLGQRAAEAVEQHRGVFVLVRVHADDDIVAAQRHPGHGRGLLTDRGRIPLVGRAGQDCDGTC